MYVNVIGRITDHRPPKRTISDGAQLFSYLFFILSEWSLLLNIADQSCPQFRLNVFAKKAEDLPLANLNESAVGKVVRIIRMQVR